MKLYILISMILFIGINTSNSQRNYDSPINDVLPKKLKELRQAIEVNNFPKTIDPTKENNKYYWKHNTSILYKESHLIIIEYGAYLFYNNQWNLRKSYPLKELNKNFGTKKQLMKKSQPYTWTQNWRIDTSNYAGWAMWYFIGITENGEKVCGFQKIETTNKQTN